MLIHTTSKSGKDITIRKAKKTDAQAMIDYADMIFSDPASYTTTLTSSGEFNFTKEMEEDFIHQMHEVSENSILLLGFHENELISLLGFHGSAYRKAKHTGFFGVSVHPKMRNEGIGRLIISALLEWAKEHPLIERVELSAFSHNENGLHLYKSMGFEEEGRKKRSGKLDSGEYVDMIFMNQFVK